VVTLEIGERVDARRLEWRLERGLEHTSRSARVGQ
jgi:hypothetical protein